jgi:hypothetical protein
MHKMHGAHHTKFTIRQLEDEWSSIHWEKVEYMTRIGLHPW